MRRLQQKIFLVEYLEKGIGVRQLLYDKMSRVKRAGRYRPIFSQKQ